MRHRIRAGLLAVIFGIQAAGIVYARFVPARFLCWAPYDQISFYRIEVQRQGRPLSTRQVAERYRIYPEARENRSIHNVLNAIIQFESTYGRSDPVDVRVVYRTNRWPEQVWMYPN